MTISPPPQDAPIRIGLVGTESSHTEHFIRFLEVEERHPGYRAAALADGESERNLDLSRRFGIDTIVQDPDELVGLVDAVIVSTRDGARHADQAVALLEAGLPVLVDKPFATTVADARRILDAAQHSDTPVLSCSALRFVPEIDRIEAARAATGELRVLQIVGPADPDSPYSGLAFYGIHHVEAAMQILGSPEEIDVHEVAVDRVGDTTVAVWYHGDLRVEFVFVAPADGHRVPFAANLIGVDGVYSTELSLNPDYNAPALARFVDTIRDGAQPYSAGQLLAPVSLIEAIVAGLNRNSIHTEREER